MARSVLITGARAAAALDIARDFACAGWTVYLADSTRSRMARWSSLGARHRLYPAPRQRGRDFRKWVCELVQQEGIDLIVPSCEEVFHLATPAMHQSLGSKLFSPLSATLMTLHDKLEFARAADGWGLPVPETHSLESIGSLDRFTASSADWVFKPRFSRFGGATIIGAGPDDLKRLRQVMDGTWLAQRRIRGDEASLYALAHKGALLGISTYASGWRLGGGASYAFEPLSAQRHEQLGVIAAKLARQASLHGQFGCDVIFDKADNPQIIECNPRATSGVHMMTGKGELAMAMADGTTLPVSETRPAYLGPAMLVFGLPLALTTGRLREWRSCLRDGRDAISRPGDRLPALGAMIDSALFSAKGLRRGITTTAATTYDIEWNGEELQK